MFAQNRAAESSRLFPNVNLNLRNFETCSFEMHLGV